MDFKKVLTTALLATSLPVMAETAPKSPEYFSIGYSAINYSDDVVDSSFSLKSAVLKAGHQVNDNVAIEIRFGVGLSGEEQETEIDSNELEVSADLKRMVGTYVRFGEWLPTQEAYPYFIVGRTSITMETEVTDRYDNSFSDSETASDNSFGVGVDIIASENNSANIELMNYYSADGSDIRGVSFSIVSRF